MRNVCRRSINYEKDYDDLDEREQKKHDAQMLALKFYQATIKEGEDACEEVTGMLVDGDKAWEQGLSQSMHQKVMNTRAYKY